MFKIISASFVRFHKKIISLTFLVLPMICFQQSTAVAQYFKLIVQDDGFGAKVYMAGVVVLDKDRNQFSLGFGCKENTLIATYAVPPSMINIVSTLRNGEKVVYARYRVDQGAVKELVMISNNPENPVFLTVDQNGQANARDIISSLANGSAFVFSGGSPEPIRIDVKNDQPVFQKILAACS